MKEEELDLLHRYLDGGMSSEELESLEELLRTDAEARRALRSLATIDAKWQEGQERPPLHLQGRPRLPDRVRLRPALGMWGITGVARSTTDHTEYTEIFKIQIPVSFPCILFLPWLKLCSDFGSTAQDHPNGNICQYSPCLIMCAP